MIKYTPSAEISNQLFTTPFEQELNKNNRWYVMESIVPWDRMAAVLSKHMSDSGRGSVDLRYVLGVMLIKGLENISDEDAIMRVQENIYMQYFVGLRTFRSEALFTPEVLVYVRQRLGEQGMKQINDIVLSTAIQNGAVKHRAEYGSQKEEEPTQNKGTIKIDATVAPQYVKYPTDCRLLNDVRLFTEHLIDQLWQLGVQRGTKPRTYRRKAKQAYLSYAKKKRRKSNETRKCKREQLQYINRNLGHIDALLDAYGRANEGALPSMNKVTYRSLLVVRHIYAQQRAMYDDRRKRIDDRIVSLSQPWVRPIVRGKAGKAVEFGAKVNMSETNGFVEMNKIDFNSFNEGGWLEQCIEAFRGRFGHYPANALVDKIYLNRSNRRFLSQRGIAHCGAPLGRPPKMSEEDKKKRKKKQNKRSEIEGRFGLGKIKYGLDKIKMRYPQTSKGHIHLIAISMNIWHLWRISLSKNISHMLQTLINPMLVYCRSLLIIRTINIH